ncbi:MAG: acyl carrier protein [Myxococcota bacterium]|jgi:acyl carrier protein
MEAEALEREIRGFLEEKLGISDIDRNEELISSGLVDSGNLVRLATRIERVAGIAIPDRDIDVDHFDSLAMIVDYVVSKAR